MIAMNNIDSLRNTTSLVAEQTIGSHTIEMRVDEQAVGDHKYRKHYLIIDGEWDMTYRRNLTIAQREYDDTVDFWQTVEV